ncbi:hypothetical protein WNY63_17765 [Pseudoalteromonas neustonica]|uniref:Uncharacterized protein n=1 Tax=Pseudoalteromonas neustonica TaxID=1840331 RepID=A0ABU9U6A2_9GAMM
MNINKKLQLLRRSQKLKAVTPYHNREIKIIAVTKNELPQVLVFVKQLFKILKARGFNILINFWGEIFIAPPNMKVYISLVINRSLKDQVFTLTKNKLDKSPYFTSIDDTLLPQLTFSFKILRPGTKQHYFNLTPIYMESDLLSRKIADEIDKRINLISLTVKRELPVQLNEVKIDDLIAIIFYFSAVYGKYSPIYYFSMRLNNFYPIKCVISKSIILLSNRLDITYQYRLKAKELKMFELLIPNIKSEGIEIYE